MSACDRCGKTWTHGTCQDTVSRRARCARMMAERRKNQAYWVQRVEEEVTHEAPNYAEQRTDRTHYTAQEFAREAFNVLDSTHAQAYGMGALPADHGITTYCYACEFAWALRAFLLGVEEKEGT